MFIFMNLTFFPMHFVGVDGMPRRIYTYYEADGWTDINFLTSLGSFALGASMLVFLYNFWKSRRSGEVAGNDPWDAATLEWATSSPPPPHDFDRIPHVTSQRPFWDMKYGGAPSNDGPAEPVHLPFPSIWPLIGALGIFLFWLGFLLPTAHWPVSIAGVVTFMFALYVWLLSPLE
jgi:heme/copper-type cytochrome/quinol oxidase subunit 1